MKYPHVLFVPFLVLALNGCGGSSNGDRVNSEDIPAQGIPDIALGAWISCIKCDDGYCQNLENNTGTSLYHTGWWRFGSPVVEAGGDSNISGCFAFPNSELSEIFDDYKPLPSITTIDGLEAYHAILTRRGTTNATLELVYYIDGDILYRALPTSAGWALSFNSPYVKAVCKVKTCEVPPP